MTETPYDTPSPADPPAPAPTTDRTSPPLVRPRGPFLGVASGLARTTGTSPTLWRVLAVVLTVFSGVGVVLYLAAALAMPAEGAGRSTLDRLRRGPDRSLRGSEVVVLVLLVVATAGTLTSSDGLLALVVLLGLLPLWARTARRRRRGTPDPVTAPAADPGPLPVARPPRRPSPVTLPTFALMAVVVALLVLLGATDGLSVTAEVVLASALGVSGLGLLAGSRWGRSPWLVLSTVGLAVALVGTVVARPLTEGGVGDRLWAPTASASYLLGVGEATLDLRELAGSRSGDPVVVEAEVRFGSLTVLLPAGARVEVDATASLGEVVVEGIAEEGRDVTRLVSVGPVDGDPVELVLVVGLGELDVRTG